MSEAELAEWERRLKANELFSSAPGRLSLTCPICGVRYERWPSQRTATCGRKCGAAYRRRNGGYHPGSYYPPRLERT